VDQSLQWIKVANHLAEISFGENSIAEVAADGKKICIAKWKDEFFAFAHKCPHASGLFNQGFIDSLGNVVCPLHRYKFCLKNGRNVSGEGYYLKHWPVQVMGEGVFVGFQKSSLFGLL
jgi:3-phenylpropionate/trans-cinnamate dioxygenase ferredoxin subunit